MFASAQIADSLPLRHLHSHRAGQSAHAPHSPLVHSNSAAIKPPTIVPVVPVDDADGDDDNDDDDDDDDDDRMPPSLQRQWRVATT